MNAEHEDHEIEGLLTRQPLRQPSANLDRRIEKLLAPFPWIRAGLALATCAALVATPWLIMNANRPPTTPGGQDKIVTSPTGSSDKDVAPLAFEPVRIEEVWSDIEPEVIMVDGDPFRRYHRRTYEHVQLIDDARNIRIEYTLPNQDVILMPVRYD